MQTAVLVVEKDNSKRETIISMLQTLGYQAMGIGIPEQAYSTLKDARFDVLFAILPKGKLDANIFAMSAKTTDEDLMVIIATDDLAPTTSAPFIDAFVRKPLSIEDIDRTIKRLFLSGNREVAKR
jgi:DNA-binding NtrC family response regulator